MGRGRLILAFCLVGAACAWAARVPAPAEAVERARAACDAAVRQALLHGPWSPKDSVDFEFLIPALPALSDSFLAEAEPLQLRPRGTGTVALRLTENGRLVRRYTVPVRVRRWDLLPVSRRELSRGHVLGAGDLEARWLESTQLADGDLISLEEALGCRITRYLLAGRPLARRQLEKVPDVLRGEHLTVVVRSGGVAVSAAAQALEDGRIGELLDVRLEETGRRLSARLVAADRAELEVAG